MTTGHEQGQAASDVLTRGIGRRTLLRAAAGLASAGLAFPGPAVAAQDDGSAHPEVLQPGTGRIRGSYLASTPSTVSWGKLPNRDTEPVAVEVLGLRLRVPYGVISARHGKGALPGELPEAWDSDPRYQRTFNPGRNISIFTPVNSRHGGLRGQLPGVRRGFPLSPLMGLMGVERPGRLGPTYGRRRQHRHQRPGGRQHAVAARAGRRRQVLHR